MWSFEKQWKCSLIESREPHSASVPQRYVTRRNMRSVASYTAQRTKDLLTFQPAEDTNSLDQVMYPSERTVAESRASLQSHTTSIEERGGGCARSQSTIPIPREATSVATMIGLLPVLNSFKTQSRSFCCLSPWIAVLCQFKLVGLGGQHLHNAGQPS